MNISFNAYYVPDTALSKERNLRAYYKVGKIQEWVFNQNMNGVDRQWVNHFVLHKYG